MIRGTRVAPRPVTDGRRVRFTLEEVRGQSGRLVRIDWLRFTLPLAAVVGVDDELPQDLTFLDLLDQDGRDIVRDARGVSRLQGPTGAMSVARSGARFLAGLFGGVFEVGAVEDKGMDYYAARCSLMYEGKAVGHCLAGGKSANQAATVHFNLHGAACLQISHEKWQPVREWIERSGGHITRIDLAVDVFEGDDICDVRTAYLSGEFDVLGKRPSQMEHGAWTSGHSRTFEVGKRQTGKCLRAYEKGDEQFGPEENDPWIRYEVEIRNSSRVIEPAVIARPADFFAGAYPFCEALLERVGEQASAEKVKTIGRLAEKVATAAVTRFLRNVERCFAPSLNALLQFPGDHLERIAERNTHRLPGSLRGFARENLVASFVAKVGDALAPAPSPSFIGA